MSRFRCVADQAARHPVIVLCRAAGVSRSGSDAWRDRQPSARAQADQQLTEQIRAIHQASRQTDGSPRVQAELRARGRAVGRRRVARLMRRAGLRGVHGQRRRVRTTVPGRAASPAPDRGARAVAPARIGAPDRVWVADISYVGTGEGLRYLAVILDGFSRTVVGRAMADHRRADLVVDALLMATQRRRPAAGLIPHRDRGARSTSLASGQRLLAAGIPPSTGSVGDGCDNAVVDAFFAGLKTELVDRQAWPTRDAARLASFEYVAVWCNRQRRRSTLGYVTPAEFEARGGRAAAA
jgi:putative transposase